MAQSAQRSVVPVDISGGASTVANDELTTDDASMAKAVRGGFAPDPRSPAGRAAGGSLVEAYQRLLKREAAAAKGAAAPGEAEDRALRKSRKRLGRHIQEGISPARAAVLAHEHYKRKGGRSTMPVWSKKVAAG